MKNISQFILTGLIFCFVLKNTFSIVNNSNGGDPIYIISNPSIDTELWYILGFSYLITVKVYFKDFFNLFIFELNNYKKLKTILNTYIYFKKTIYFNFIIKGILIILSIFTFGLGVNLFTDNYPENIDILNFLLLTYLTYIFNINYKIINLKLIN
jgi:hypothetical protein